MDNLPKCQTNYNPLSPLTFLKRAAACYANRTSVIYEGIRFTWPLTYQRCRRLASSLRAFNISRNDVVSVLAPNVPAMYEMHFGVPMAGAVLNTINTRLDANNIATILRHSEAKVLFVDYEYVPKAKEALGLLRDEQFQQCGTHAVQKNNSSLPLVIVIDDINSPTGIRIGEELEYEEMVHNGDPNFVPEEILDEWAPIALNYTSGTTSAPKGVVYSHRSTYLSVLSTISGWEMGTEPVYLWTLPMFHCNGWTFPWGVAARGGTNVCLRYTLANDIYKNISLHKVTHMCCAPVIFNIILEAKPSERREIKSPVKILTGGSPPPPSLLEKIESLGFHVTHGYGMTEATGTVLVCEWQSQWNELPKHEQAQLKARQGINILTLADVDVIKNLDTMESVPRDGKTMGEIVLRGNNIMKGYLKDAELTSKAFRNGWFFTGDVGVIHRDGYIEIKDRCKDVIISGGENISSVEVESILYRHPMVLETAVVAIPHPRWGESPCAFIVLKKNSQGKTCDVTEAQIIDYCRMNMSHFMVPKMVMFVEELPKTSTGKVQKVELRIKAKAFDNLLFKKNKSSQCQVNQNIAASSKQIVPVSRL